MSWWQIVMAWLFFQGQLGALEPGQELESPPVMITWADGRSFMVNLKAARIK